MVGAVPTLSWRLCESRRCLEGKVRCIVLGSIPAYPYPWFSFLFFWFSLHQPVRFVAICFNFRFGTICNGNLMGDDSLPLSKINLLRNAYGN